MNWELLLNNQRSFWPPNTPEDERPKDNILDVFQVDSSRITNSSAYHRLQRKTQVLPFPRTDYARSRLTHTMEVSDCGRELARMIGRKLVAANKMSPVQLQSMEDIVPAACKSHDIGNPPFGHSGEYAIQSWATKNTSSDSSQRECRFVLSERKHHELCSFDGNGQGFRLVTVLSGWRRKGGLQLTNAVLATFCKYPWTPDFSGTKRKYSVPIGSEEIAQSAFQATGLLKLSQSQHGFKYCRHPLAYLVEAADDICYITSDLEDASNAFVADHHEVVKFFEQIAWDAIGDSYDRHRFLRRQELLAAGDKKALRRYLKDHAQRALKIAAADSFIENYEKIMSGTFEGSLFDNSRVASQLRAVRDYFKTYVYDNVDKVRNEVFGAKVVTGLLDFYSEALFSARDQLHVGRSLVSGPNCIDEITRRNIITFPMDNYFPDDDWETKGSLLVATEADDIAQMVIDYISGMTDPYATEIYHQVAAIMRPRASW